MKRILLKKGLIIDGSGKEPFKGDIAIKEEKIFNVGPSLELKGDKEIDLKGLAVAPGFIDVKSRIDFDWSFLNFPNLQNLISQGITSVITGNFGFSLFPVLGDNLVLELEKWAPLSNMTIDWSSIEELFTVLERKGIGVNFGTLLGYRTLRRGIVGEVSRQLKSEELQIIRKFIEESLQKGVKGVSVEFSRLPNNPESDEELFEIFKAFRTSKKGVLSINFAYGEKESPLFLLRDLLKMASEISVSLEISEFAVKGENTEEILKLIKKATCLRPRLRQGYGGREGEGGQASGQGQKGVNIVVSITPYQKDIISLSSYLPSWLHEGGLAKMYLRLKDPGVRKLILKEIKKNEREISDLVIAQAPTNPKFIGFSFKEIAKKQEVSAGELLINLLLATEGRALGVRYLKEVINKEGLEAIIKEPFSMISAEAGGHSSSCKEKGVLPHPRDFGAFPYFIQKFVINRKILTLEEAIHKITGLPAATFCLEKRGILKKDNFADLVIFDPREIKSNADFKNPNKFSSGIKMVFINGCLVYNNGVFSANLRGKVLKNES